MFHLIISKSIYTISLFFYGRLVNKSKDHCHSVKVLLLLLHSKQIDLPVKPGPFCTKFACSTQAVGFSWVLWFFSFGPKKCRLGHPATLKLLICMNVNVNGYLSLYGSPEIWDPEILSPASCLKSAEVDMTHNGKWMDIDNGWIVDGWLDGWTDGRIAGQY